MRLGSLIRRRIFAIRQAAIEFCERTRFWRYEDEFAITSTDIDGLTAPSGSVIYDIDAVWFNGRKLTPKTTGQLVLEPTWRSGATAQTSTPKYVTQTEPNTIQIVPFQTGQLKFALFLKPSQDATEVPDFLVDQHRETIAHGALARILLIPNQSFTNPDMAAAFGMAFPAKDRRKEYNWHHRPATRTSPHQSIVSLRSNHVRSIELY